MRIELPEAEYQLYTLWAVSHVFGSMQKESVSLVVLGDWQLWELSPHEILHVSIGLF